MKATIYIPDDRATIYEQAKEKLGDSVSATFLRCLERELEAQRMKTGRIVVQIVDQEERISTKAFEGRWIIGSAIEGEKFCFSELSDHDFRAQGGYAASVALTKGGRIVVICFDNMGNAVRFSVYEDYDDFKDAESNDISTHPIALVQAVAAELGVEQVENLDI